MAIGIDWDGRRQVLGVELSNRESRSSWAAFVKGLKARGLHGGELVVSHDHAGLKRAVAKLLPEAVWHTSCGSARLPAPQKPTTIAARNCGGSTTVAT